MRELFEYFGLPEDLFKHIFGNLYSRDVLTQRERELCAVAGLCVLNRTNELRSHIIASLRAGATKEEVAEVILQMSTYGGMPVCIEGLALLREVLGNPPPIRQDCSRRVKHTPHRGRGGAHGRGREFPSCRE